MSRFLQITLQLASAVSEVTAVKILLSPSDFLSPSPEALGASMEDIIKSSSQIQDDTEAAMTVLIATVIDSVLESSADGSTNPLKNESDSESRSDSHKLADQNASLALSSPVASGDEDSQYDSCSCLSSCGSSCSDFPSQPRLRNIAPWAVYAGHLPENADLCPQLEPSEKVDVVHSNGSRETICFLQPRGSGKGGREMVNKKRSTPFPSLDLDLDDQSKELLELPCITAQVSSWSKSHDYYSKLSNSKYYYFKYKEYYYTLPPQPGFPVNYVNLPPTTVGW